MNEIVSNFLDFSVSTVQFYMYLCISKKKDQETSKEGAVITTEIWGRRVFDPNKTTTRKPSGRFYRVK
jgi:hypothetical protein